jgi:hypothetical protein
MEDNPIILSMLAKINNVLIIAEYNPGLIISHIYNRAEQLFNTLNPYWHLDNVDDST